MLIDKLDVLLTAIGVWLLADGIISIRLYLKTMDETGKRMQNWRYDHSIRLIRSILGLLLIVLGIVIR